ncbi:hypothetical protein [Pyrodictium delaneyi]|uniref:hypothetical protein n=1 Tax=Pyrodictium delaneyi TaxID=1273541 RepID=UPI001179A8B3|nr:hypothetical protein [Pyrodictium delaneyi]
MLAYSITTPTKASTRGVYGSKPRSTRYLYTLVHDGSPEEVHHTAVYAATPPTLPERVILANKGKHCQNYIANVAIDGERYGGIESGAGPLRDTTRE